ncbi:PAS domain-containing protein [Mycolicibacterium hodleri]|uniref:PAS domain S-box protein n=1 Tax=Mycolicibacterium hodleri TaxID=49897 RepID=A0A502EBB9_9MYCO|nr:PAS domain-containing protein [Mycolicibacterium hodleri]TPG35025.1 PAS domain S-box protein [Mycolicibacterium hodleri]
MLRPPSSPLSNGTGEDPIDNGASGGAELFQHRFKLLAEMSSDGVCVHRDGRIVYANAAAIRWMGVDPAVGLIGRRVAEFVHADSYPDVERRLQGLQREGDSARPTEVVMGRPEKSARDVQASSTRIEWNGSPAVLSTFKDLTAVKASAVLKVQAALLDHVSDAVIGVSLTGTVTAWNAGAEAVYRLDAEQALNLPVNEAVGAPLDAQSDPYRRVRRLHNVTAPFGWWGAI